MTAIAKCLVLLAAFLNAKVTLLDGRTVDGQLVEIGDSVEIRSGDKTTSFALDDVVRVDVEVVRSEAQPQAQSEIVLLDGSVLEADKVTATAETVSGKCPTVGSVEISRAHVRAVRIRPADENQAEEWSAFLKRNNEKDLLVIPKRDGSGLDFLAGIVSSVNEAQIPFLLDGDEIPVPRERVFGIVFGRTPNAAERLAGATRVMFADHTVVHASEIRLEQSKVMLTTSWGQRVTADMYTLVSIDFSGGRMHFLSDLVPVSETYFGLDAPGRSWGPLFEADVATRDGFSRPWKMSRDRFPNWGQPPLRLRGTVYRKGICVFPHARIEYALDEKYVSLKALVGVDDEVAFNQLPGKPPTAVELRIEADGDVVWEQLISAPNDPIELNIDLRNISTLALVVDFGDGNSACDYLDLADARLIVASEAKSE